MKRINVPASATPGAVSCVFLTPGEAHSLCMPLASGSVEVVVDGRGGLGHWDGNNLRLDFAGVVADGGHPRTTEWAMSRDGDVLSLEPISSTSSGQKPLVPMMRLEDALGEPLATPAQVDVAVKASLLRSTPAYLAARERQPLPIRDPVDAEVLAGLLRASARVLTLAMHNTPTRTSLGLRYAIEMLARHDVDRVYVAVPNARLHAWADTFLMLSSAMSAESSRGHVTFLSHDRLPRWHPARGRALLMIDAGEQAVARWGARLRTVIGRSHRAVVLGDAADGHPPRWEASVADDAHPIALQEPGRPAGLDVLAYDPRATEAWLDGFLAHTASAWSNAPHRTRVHTTLPGIFGPQWTTDSAARASLDTTRVRAVTAAVQDADPAALVHVLVSSTGAARVIAAALDPARTRQRRDAPALVLGPGDRATAGPADLQVHADPLDLLQLRFPAAPSVIVSPQGTAEHAWLTLALRILAKSREENLAPSRVVERAGVRYDGWLDTVACGLRGDAEITHRLRARMSYAVEQERLRLRRLADEEAATATPPPVASRHDPDLVKNHQEVLEQVLASRGHVLVRVAAGTHSLQITTQGDGEGGITGSEILSIGADASATKDVVADPGSVGAERLLGPASARRVSLDVPVVPLLDHVPVPQHAARLTLARRELRRPRTFSVTSELLSDTDDGPAVESVVYGQPVSRGMPRRTAVTTPEDASAPEPSVLIRALRQVEADARSRAATVLSARIAVGDDVGLVEEWQRADGPSVEIEVELHATGGVVHRDASGNGIRVLDICDTGHLTDETWERTCPTCGGDRCPTCPNGTQFGRCRLCDEPACHVCLADGLCPVCVAPVHVPEADTERERAWRIRDGMVFISHGAARVVRHSGEDSQTLVTDDEVAGELADRRRATALEHGLPVDAAVVFAPLIADMPLPGDVLWADERRDWLWEIAEPEEAQELPAVAEASVLSVTTGPPVRAFSSFGLRTEYIGRLRSEIPPPVPPALVRREYLERQCLAIGESGFEHRVERHCAGRPVEVVERQALHMRPPNTPRDDEDGQLLARLTAGRFKVDMLGVNRSLVLRIDGQGRIEEWFAAAARKIDHGSELAWHRLARGYGLPPGTAVLTTRDGFAELRDEDFAAPQAARLLERTVVPHAVFGPVEGRTRAVTAQHLKALQRDRVATASRALEQGLAERMHSAVAHLREQSPPAMLVRLAHGITEEWEGGGGTRFVSYTVPPGGVAWPPLDDVGEARPDFDIDSAGHLHVVGGGWSCEACDRSYCRACGPRGELRPCGSCGQSACGRCRDRTHEDLPPAANSGCNRCGRVPCDDCGRRIEVVSCAFCARDVCRHCVDGELCETCLSLRRRRKMELPADIPWDGCRVAAAEDGATTVVAITGASRSEIVVLHEGEVRRWMTFDPLSARAHAAVAAARRAGEDLAIPESQHPISTTDVPEACVWREVARHIEVELGGERIARPTSGADLITDLAALLNDGGLYPTPAVPSEDVAKLMPKRPRSPTLPVRVFDVGSTYALTWDGVLRTTAAPEAGEPRVEDLAPWRAADPLKDGRQRYAASIDGIEVLVAVAGRDVELNVRTPQSGQRLQLSADPVDRCAAQLAALAGWKGECPVITSAAVPSDADALRVMNGRRIDRKTRLGHRTSDPAPSVDTLALLHAVTRHEGLFSDCVSDGATEFAVVAERFRFEPSTFLRLGIQVHDLFSVGEQRPVLVYEVWSDGGEPVASVGGVTAGRVRFDEAGHAIADPRLCAYCARPDCGTCGLQVVGCVVCEIEVCQRCGHGGVRALCPACRKMAPLSARQGKKVFGPPYPKVVGRGEDIRHTVTVGRYDGGYRIVRAGAVEGVRVIGMHEPAAEWLKRILG